MITWSSSLSSLETFSKYSVCFQMMSNIIFLFNLMESKLPPSLCITPRKSLQNAILYYVS